MNLTVAQVTAGRADGAREEVLQMRAEMLESGRLHDTTTARLRQAQQVWRRTSLELQYLLLKSFLPLMTSCLGMGIRIGVGLLLPASNSFLLYATARSGH